MKPWLRWTIITSWIAFGLVPETYLWCYLDKLLIHLGADSDSAGIFPILACGASYMWILASLIEKKEKK